jgi:shikimate dehydrogenase
MTIPYNTFTSYLVQPPDYKAVYDLLKESGIDASLSFIISGSGGMAKAVAAAFRDAGFANGTILARNEEKGQALAGLYGFKYLKTLPPEGSSSILVNVTPLGMKGKYPDELSFPYKWVRSSKLVFDVVASPIETPLLKLARDSGIPTIDGGQVAVIQALEQFTLYTECVSTPDQVAQAASFARNI